MKWKAREGVVDLLSDITIASSLPVSEQMTMLRNCIKKTEKVIAFLDVAQSAHLMTEMNASMLKKEYLALKDNLQEEWSNVYGKSKSLFSESFFDVPAGSIKASADEAHELIGKNFVPATASFSRTHESFPETSVHDDIKDNSNAVEKNRSINRYPDQRQQHVSQTPKVVTTQVLEDKKVFSPPSQTPHVAPTALANLAVVSRYNGQSHAAAVPSMSQTIETSRVSVSQPVVATVVREKNEGGRDDRRKIILDLIKEKPALTVKDIVKSIPSVSEKTIQRELLAMVSENVLVKRGERRWSTYSLRAQ
jgi:hypothetical protein